jgi:ATP-dependent DNA helicase RecG
VSEARRPLTLRDLRELELSVLAGVGPKLSDRLEEVGLRTILDLLQHYPRRYIDRSRRAAIGDLTVGEEATVFGVVQRVSGRRTRNRRALVEVVVADDGAALTATFFNQAWRERQLSVGTEVALFGKVDAYRGKRQMVNPVVDVIGRSDDPDSDPQSGPQTGRIVPIYPQSGKAEVFTWQIRKLVDEALRRCRPRRLADPLDEQLLDELDIVERNLAYTWIHRPDSFDEQRAATRRLVFDEFLRMQVGLVARKRALEADLQGVRHDPESKLLSAFHAQLPYELTGDQQRAIREIVDDMASRAPMHRLLQGDVGSGKTLVALSALLVSVDSGFQGAFMAPTEVLAEQHFLGARALLDGLHVGADSSLFGDRPVRVELLTNATSAAARREIQQGMQSGEIDVLIGTHALLYDDALFRSLGIAVIDEQHRFGVEQRALLRDKGAAANDGRVPDVLVMTATPIPRTAAMLVYGDLDKSEIREMPPGRTPITTQVVGPSPLDRAAAFDRLRREVEAGRQAYVVCPLVEGSDRVQARSATEELARLEAEELAGLRLALLHGQMPSREKDATMTAFRAGEVDVLVATTVIEVGVDVPNATVMIVMDADRFGLSQLHQLRGRIGRGGGASYCFLFAEPTTPDGEARMEAIAASVDGFLLAERDLEIRGAGEVFGERQSGFSDLKLGRVPRDEAVVLEARRVAERILDGDPGLARHAALREEVEDLLGDDVDFLFKS